MREKEIFLGWFMLEKSITTAWYRVIICERLKSHWQTDKLDCHTRLSQPTLYKKGVSVSSEGMEMLHLNSTNELILPLQTDHYI